MQSEIFTGGMYQELYHLQTALANFICMLNVIYLTDDDHPEDRPLIIQHLLELFGLSNYLSFRKWYNINKKRYPWITHMFLVMLHNFIRKDTEIASCYRNQLTYQTHGVSQLPPAIFEDAEIEKHFNTLGMPSIRSVIMRSASIIGATNQALGNRYFLGLRPRAPRASDTATHVYQNI